MVGAVLATVTGLLALGAPAQAARTGAKPAVAGHSVSSGERAKLATGGYWTPERMKAAKNLDTVAATPAAVRAAQAQAHPSGPAVRIPGAAPAQTAVPATVPRAAAPLAGPTGSPWPGNYYSAPATTTGKVFFNDHLGGGWVCSASVVNSNGKDSVFTAGHCVYGTAGGELPAGETWHSNWEFVPDYSYGYAPYGTWWACQLWTMTNYINSGDLPDDMGAAVMCPNNGTHIVSLLGGQGIAWNYGNTYVYDFGYPAASPFNGQTLQYCDGNEFNAWSGTIGLLCNFTGGSSGGPWLGWFNGTWGYVNGVNSFGVNGLPDDIFSPYFGDNASALYNSVANL
jgi:hypothetical protein